MPSLDELTDPAAVRQALAQFDELGRVEFLRRHGFRPARRFWLIVNGKRYDSKAIAGVAWGLQHTGGAGWLRAEEFSGGDATVRSKLEGLGFSVVEDPAQASDEAVDGGHDATGTVPSVAHPKTWIFQANPNAFDITQYLVTRPAYLLWLVRQKAADMDIGDRVFFWRAIGSGSRTDSGVIGEAEIMELPSVQRDDAAAESFWVRKSGTPDAMLPQNRVKLRLLRVADGTDLIQRDIAAAHPVLAKMQVLTGRTGTNFLLKPDEADALSALWASANTVPVSAGTMADEVEADVAAIRSDATIPETTRLALVQARRGQGQFRAGLMRRWKGACAVTGVLAPQVLRASHIRPWRGATNADRLDPSNGLLLAAHLDALFDAGLISFEGDGTMLISTDLPATDRARLGLPCSLRADLTPAEQRFLAHHRSTWFGR
jgi:hypothetical protein